MKPIDTSRSSALLVEASQRIPGGVNSPVRAFAAVDGDPLFIAKGEGRWMTDEDGNRLLDLVGSWGPLILGHAHPVVLKAAMEALQKGSTFGAPTEGEVRFAEELCAAHPVLDRVRLCSSGTEATMHAIRLARGATRPHGWQSSPQRAVPDPHAARTMSPAAPPREPRDASVLPARSRCTNTQRAPTACLGSAQ